jgi:predicted ribosomally synthesized peptide with SipW-like signal peptide
MKKKILVVVSLLIIVALLTTGAFAWFTSTRTASQGSISAGTLNIQLASNASSTEHPTVWADTVVPPWNLTAMAPGDEVFGCLWVKNMGTVDSVGVRWDFKNLVNTLGVKLEDRMQITDLFTSDSLYDWPEALLLGGAFYQDGAYDENSDGKISLGEMSRWSNRYAPNTFDWVNDNETAHYLIGNIPPASDGFICMTLKMMNGTPAEDNPFQGDGLTYDVTVSANNPEITVYQP